MATLEELQLELTEVSAALSAAYTGAEYEIQDGQTRRRLKRQDINSLIKRKGELQLSIDRLSGTGRGVRYGMPVDNNSLLNKVV